MLDLPCGQVGEIQASVTVQGCHWQQTYPFAGITRIRFEGSLRCTLSCRQPLSPLTGLPSAFLNVTRSAGWARNLYWRVQPWEMGWLDPGVAACDFRGRWQVGSWICFWGWRRPVPRDAFDVGGFGGVAGGRWNTGKDALF